MGCCQAVDSQIVQAQLPKLTSMGIIRRRNQKYGKQTSIAVEGEKMENVKKIEI